MHREANDADNPSDTASAPILLSRTSGDVAQLVRALPCHGRGRGFEPRRPRHHSKALRMMGDPPKRRGRGLDMGALSALSPNLWV